MARYRLLAVDDDNDCADLIVRTATKCGYEALPITNAESLAAAIARWSPDVVTLDIGMPNVDGAGALSMLAEVKYKGRVIIVSGKSERLRNLVAELGLALGLAIIGNEEKPVDILRLRKVLLSIGDGLA